MITVEDKINFKPVHIDEIYSGETETKLEASYIEKLQKLELAERHENNRAKKLVNDENEANLKIRKRDENLRIACLLSILESIPKNEKVIIWARYTQGIKDILSILGDQAISCFG